MKGKILVFASGDAKGGGSGFQELVENARTGVLEAEIVAVVSHHKNGGVKKRAKKLDVHFEYWPGPFDAKGYQRFFRKYGEPLVALSGWIKLVKGLALARIINIHPGPLPEFGGPGMYGHHVHEAVIKAFEEGKISCSAVSMHFVSSEYDRGPIFFQYPVLIRQDDTPDTLAARVNKIEHGWQSWVTNLILSGQIRLQGEKLIVPDWYTFHQPINQK